MLFGVRRGDGGGGGGRSRGSITAWGRAVRNIIISFSVPSPGSAVLFDYFRHDSREPFAVIQYKYTYSTTWFLLRNETFARPGGPANKFRRARPCNNTVFAAQQLRAARSRIPTRRDPE